MKEIKNRLEEGFKKIQQAVDTSNLTDLRERVQGAIAEARTDIDEHMNEFEKANAAADQFLDPIIDKTVHSKWTPVIVATCTLIAVAVGVAIGMHL